MNREGGILKVGQLRMPTSCVLQARGPVFRLDPKGQDSHYGIDQTDGDAVSATEKSAGDYRGPRAAQRRGWIPRSDVHRGRRRSTHHPHHPHRAPGDVDRCRNDYPAPWDRVRRRDHAPGDTP